MRVEQRRWTPEQGWNQKASEQARAANVVFVFGSGPALQDKNVWRDLRSQHPNAHIFGSSTAGEIVGTQVLDDTLVATAVSFADTRLELAQVNISECKDSLDAGERLGKALSKKDLTHVLLLSDGHHVNGSELVRGIQKRLPSGVTVTGGLAGDGARFEHTYVISDAPPQEGQIAVLGLYGSRIRIGYGSLGGWDPFGPQRLVTRSEANVLYELDGQPALGLYKKYLGEHAKQLPAAGLRFPLSVRLPTSNREVVRTILDVNEEKQSLVFAGDVPVGSYARLMKANFDRLIDGAHGAARTSYEALGSSSPALALLISCVGRKLVLRQRTEEELEAVREVLGPEATMTGFYSYGEICPAAPNANCDLHNQTMTITTIDER